jgi:hypothetical protein
LRVEPLNFSQQIAHSVGGATAFCAGAGLAGEAEVEAMAAAATDGDGRRRTETGGSGCDGRFSLNRDGARVPLGTPAAVKVGPGLLYVAKLGTADAKTLEELADYLQQDYEAYSASLNSLVDGIVTAIEIVGAVIITVVTAGTASRARRSTSGSRATPSTGARSRQPRSAPRARTSWRSFAEARQASARRPGSRSRARPGTPRSAAAGCRTDVTDSSVL